MNLPNKITLFRILLIPIIIVLNEITYLKEQTIFFDFLTLNNFITLIIFLVGAFSDFLDGYIARKHNLVTDFGKFADPLADKILVLTLMIILLEQQTLLKGYVVTIILAREFIVTGFRLMASNKNIVIAAGWLGKIKTNCQFVMIIMLLIVKTDTVPINIYDYITLGVIYLTLIMTIISGAEYLIKNKQVIISK